jgi:Mrp family chromosome partitioning ATPase
VAANGDNRGGPNPGAGSSLVVRAPQGTGAAISFVNFAPQPPYDERLIFWAGRNLDTAAAFRLLRQRLIERGDPRIVLCTSATQGEGKTTLATNLALAFAELGKHRVLLIETSFRSAAVGEVFGFKPPAGFAGQLAKHRQRAHDPWVVVQISGSQLYVMAADPRCCPQCAAVLAEEVKFCGMCGAEATTTENAALDAVTFAKAIDQFRESFHYLVLDAPPVLASGDVNLIQDSADAIVFATRRGHSAARSLRRAIEQVAPAPVAAVVLIEN